MVPFISQKPRLSNRYFGSFTSLKLRRFDCTSNKPLLGLEILARRGELDGAPLGIALALKSALEHLHEKGELVARFDAPARPMEIGKKAKPVMMGE